MCGIFGIIWHQSDRTPEQERLQETARLLRHRGPDGCGTFSAPGVALVHTRLSLLDLNERSNQPFWDRTHRFALVYNGEIYNFADLRAELEKEGVEFRTTCDTEVLLEALIRWGPDVALPRFEGMFAFGLYDRDEKSLLLARDRFGIKPLFIYQTANTFLFASEIQAMRPWIQFEPDSLSISAFLYGFSGPTKGFTFFKRIQAIEPGAVVTVAKGGSVHTARFFSLGDFVEHNETERLRRTDPNALVDQLDELLNASVKSQLVADVPVGALCSGGLDSSIIMAIAAKHHNNLAIFHANVVGPLSEYQAALRLAKHLRLELEAVDVTDQDFIEKIPAVTERYGQPFYACPHSIPFLMVSQLIHQSHVKAVLSGEGADECFLGYSNCVPNIRSRIGIRAMFRRAKNLLRRKKQAQKFEFYGLPYVRGGDSSSDSSLALALHNRFEVFGEALEMRTQFVDGPMRETENALKSLDLLHYNLRSLLHRNDAMGMAASVECRFPFLDSRLVKFAVNMPLNCKIRLAPTLSFERANKFFDDKWVLRQVADRYLPREFSRRKKKPFPVNAYSPERFQMDAGFFRKSFIADFFGLSANQTRFLLDHASHDLKWKLVQVEVWAQLFCADVPKNSIAAKLGAHLSIKTGLSAEESTVTPQP